MTSKLFHFCNSFFCNRGIFKKLMLIFKIGCVETEGELTRVAFPPSSNLGDGNQVITLVVSTLTSGAI